MIKDDKIKIEISICVISYNQEKFIEECLRGILSQKIDATVQLVLVDDNSQDQTFDIVKTIIKNYTGNFIVDIMSNEKNRGMISNFKFALSKCKGDYIAICEGDDYWIDPHKLYKQLQFLKINPLYGICFHNVAIHDQSTGSIIKDNLTRKVSSTTSMIDLVSGNYIHTPSVVLRNDFVIPPWFEEVELGDWTLYMLQIGQRKIKKLDDVMAHYRVHSSSVWSQLDENLRVKRTKHTFEVVYNNLNIPSKHIKKALKLFIKEKESSKNNVITMLFKSILK